MNIFKNTACFIQLPNREQVLLKLTNEFIDHKKNILSKMFSLRLSSAMKLVVGGAKFTSASIMVLLLIK